MENYSRWLPTREATAYLGVSSQFLKKNRDIKDGFLLEEKHYILGANINSSILWNVSEILKEFHYRGRLIRESQKIINDLKAEESAVSVCIEKQTFGSDFELQIIAQVMMRFSITHTTSVVYDEEEEVVVRLMSDCIHETA